MLDHPLLEAFYTAYNGHDSTAAAALYLPDGWHDEIAMGGHREGRDDLASGLAGFFDMLPDVTFFPGPVLRSADWRVVNYRMTGTFTPRAKEGENPPRPRQITLNGLHLFLIRENQIQGTRDYWDKDAFLAQIG